MCDPMLEDEDDLYYPIKLLDEDDFLLNLCFICFLAISGMTSVSIFFSFLHECGTAGRPMIGMIATTFSGRKRESLLISSSRQ